MSSDVGLSLGGARWPTVTRWLSSARTTALFPFSVLRSLALVLHSHSNTVQMIHDTYDAVNGLKEQQAREAKDDAQEPWQDEAVKKVKEELDQLRFEVEGLTALLVEKDKELGTLKAQKEAEVDKLQGLLGRGAEEINKLRAESACASEEVAKLRVQLAASTSTASVLPRSDIIKRDIVDDCKSATSAIFARRTLADKGKPKVDANKMDLVTTRNSFSAHLVDQSRRGFMFAVVARSGKALCCFDGPTIKLKKYVAGAKEEQFEIGFESAANDGVRLFCKQANGTRVYLAGLPDGHYAVGPLYYTVHSKASIFHIDWQDDGLCRLTFAYEGTPYALGQADILVVGGGGDSVVEHRLTTSEQSAADALWCLTPSEALFAYVRDKLSSA